MTPTAPLGQPLPLLLTGSTARSGLGLLFLGEGGYDAGGCGLVLPGLGELLLALAPAPQLVELGPLREGTCALAPLVPARPVLVGTTRHFQGVAVDMAQPWATELSNALAVILGP